MARGRYSQNELSDRSHFSTYKRRVESMGLRDVDLLAGAAFFEYSTSAQDRLDTLAHRFFNDDGYWWVLALVNKIDYPLGLVPGTKLRIPKNVSDVLRKIQL